MLDVLVGSGRSAGDPVSERGRERGDRRRGELGFV